MFPTHILESQCPASEPTHLAMTHPHAVGSSLYIFPPLLFHTSFLPPSPFPLCFSFFLLSQFGSSPHLNASLLKQVPDLDSILESSGKFL